MTRERKPARQDTYREVDRDKVLAHARSRYYKLLRPRAFILRTILRGQNIEFAALAERATDATASLELYDARGILAFAERDTTIDAAV